MPRPCHDLTMPFFWRPRYSTAVERRPVGYLPAFGIFRLPRGVPRILLSEAYQSFSQRSIPTTVKSGSSTLQRKDDLLTLTPLTWRIWWAPNNASRWQMRFISAFKGLNCWASSSDISGYHADFHEGHGTVGAWQRCGMACVNLTLSMAWERHGHGM